MFNVLTYMGVEAMRPGGLAYFLFVLETLYEILLQHAE